MEMRVAAYAVITDADERVLLAHWNQNGRSGWTMPGGGLEDGEDPEHAVRREVREETGYRVAVGELLGIHSRVIPATQRMIEGEGPLQTLRIVYSARITGGRLRDEVDGSTDRAEWFPIPGVWLLQRVKLVDIAMKMAKLA